MHARIRECISPCSAAPAAAPCTPRVPACRAARSRRTAWPCSARGTARRESQASPDDDGHGRIYEFRNPKAKRTLSDGSVSTTCAFASASPGRSRTFQSFTLKFSTASVTSTLVTYLAPPPPSRHVTHTGNVAPIRESHMRIRYRTRYRDAHGVRIRWNGGRLCGKAKFVSRALTAAARRTRWWTAPSGSRFPASRRRRGWTSPRRGPRSRPGAASST